MGVVIASGASFPASAGAYPWVFFCMKRVVVAAQGFRALGSGASGSRTSSQFRTLGLVLLPMHA